MICGFCGEACSSNLVQTSRGKGKVYYGKIDSDCPYYFDYGKKVGSLPSRNNPCTNRLLHCDIKECKQVVWSYNMKHHYLKKHPNAECEEMMTKRDISTMKKASV